MRRLWLRCSSRSCRYVFFTLCSSRSCRYVFFTLCSSRSCRYVFFTLCSSRSCRYVFFTLCSSRSCRYVFFTLCSSRSCRYVFFTLCSSRSCRYVFFTLCSSRSCRYVFFTLCSSRSCRYVFFILCSSRSCRYVFFILSSYSYVFILKGLTRLPSIQYLSWQRIRKPFAYRESTYKCNPSLQDICLNYSVLGHINTTDMHTVDVYKCLLLQGKPFVPQRTRLDLGHCPFFVGPYTLLAIGFLCSWGGFTRCRSYYYVRHLDRMTETLLCNFAKPLMPYDSHSYVLSSSWCSYLWAPVDSWRSTTARRPPPTSRSPTATRFPWCSCSGSLTLASSSVCCSSWAVSSRRKHRL